MSTASGSPRPARRDVIGRVVRTAGLALMWAALWADLSLATITAGAFVAVGAQLAFPTLAPRPSGRVNPLALAKLGVVFAWMLITANLSVLRRVSSPRLSLSPMVVDVALPPCSDAVTTVVANAVTLTPGTLTLDVARTADAVVLTVHILDARDPQEARAGVQTLYKLASAAFPTGAGAHPDQTPTKDTT